MRHLVSGLMLLIVGCAESSTLSWEGKHRDELVRAWGAPETVMMLPEARTRMIYVRGMVAGSMDYMCRIIFETDKDGLIQSQSYYGCP
jgi:hypothetical protein